LKECSDSNDDDVAEVSNVEVFKAL
jgi:hypothetical protein